MKRAAFTALLLLAALAVFYLAQKGYSDREHARFQSGLWRLKHLDSTFNEDLLRARFSLLESYDAFQTYQLEMDRLLGDVRKVPRFVPPEGREELARPAGELAAMFLERRRLFERFKSLNAVLSNSRRYFPVAVDELTGRLNDAEDEERELGAIIQRLTRVLLAHVSSAGSLSAGDLAAPDALRDWASAHPGHAEAAFVSSLARHARTLLDGKNELDTLTRRLLSLPTAAGIERLSSLYERDLAGALRRTAHFQTLLYALVALLAGMVGYALWALRAANRGLERRVGERTAALELENVERRRAETELAHSLSVLQTTLESTADGIVAIKSTGEVVTYNTRFASMWGLSPEILRERDALGLTTYVRAQVRDEESFVQRINELLADPPAEACDVLELKDGRIFERHVRARQVDGRNAGMVANFRDITARRRAEDDLEKAHRQLLETSRQAGMAEVATSVLHNVGNVLNSVNVSATLVTDRVRRSKVSNVVRLRDLLHQHRDELGRFLTEDPRGRMIPAYLDTLAESLGKEQVAVISELETLRKNIDHIKDVVAMQQSYAKTSGVAETVTVPDLVEDAFRMNAGSLARHDVKVIRDYACRQSITTEKHKVLQILVNLIRNATHACDESGGGDKRIVIRTAADERDVEISVIDNGVGIPAENLTRIFAHGFTTRKHGHGFGLHSGALAARELGGSLTVRSEGLGKGATFTLRLPINPEHAR